MWLGPEFWSAIIGAIVGAAAGAVPSWLLSRKAARDAASLEDVRNRKEDRLAGTRLFLAITYVANDIFSARKQVEKMLLERPSPESHNGHIHKRLSVLSGARVVPVNPFDNLDLAVIATSDDVELVNSIEFLGRCYETQCSIFADYRLQKQRLFEIYEKAKERSASTSEGLANYTLDPEYKVILADREATTEIIARGLLDALYENSKLAYSVAMLYNKAVDGSLAHLELPKMETGSVAEKFPDVVAPDDEAQITGQ